MYTILTVYANGYAKLQGLSHCLECNGLLPKTQKFFCSELCMYVYNYPLILTKEGIQNIETQEYIHKCCSSEERDLHVIDNIIENVSREKYGLFLKQVDSEP